MIICSCSNISDKNIDDLISSGKIKEKLSDKSRCNSCNRNLKSLINSRKQVSESCNGNRSNHCNSLENQTCGD